LAASKIYWRIKMIKLIAIMIKSLMRIARVKAKAFAKIKANKITMILLLSIKIKCEARNRKTVAHNK